MKAKYYIFVLLLITCVQSSCNKDDINFENEYNQSYKEWQIFKKSSDNSYRYIVSGASWTGDSWETIITVINGIVTQRDFRYISRDPLYGSIPEEDMSWIENEDDINSRQNTNAAGAITLDEIYEKAQSEWLLKRGNEKTYFETENSGLISLCGYVENACADDCFRGIRISYIEALY